LISPKKGGTAAYLVEENQPKANVKKMATQKIGQGAFFTTLPAKYRIRARKQRREFNTKITVMLLHALVKQISKK